MRLIKFQKHQQQYISYNAHRMLLYVNYCGTEPLTYATHKNDPICRGARPRAPDHYDIVISRTAKGSPYKLSFLIRPRKRTP